MLQEERKKMTIHTSLQLKTDAQENELLCR